MKKLFVSIYLCFLLFALASVSQAAEFGCCEIKNTPDDGTRVFETKTLKDCKAIDLDNIDKYSTFHADKQVANDKKSCEQKILAERGIGPSNPIDITPQVGIPDSNFVAGQPVRIQESTTTLANYIIAIFKYSTGVIGIIAAIVLMMAGIIWLTAAGNQEQIGSARKMIGGGLMGLVLTFGAFIILSMVNTNLVNLKITPITKIQHIDVDDIDQGCCKKGSNTPIGTFTTEKLSEHDCNKLKEQVGSEDNQYRSIEFFAMSVPKDNDCVITKGCCYVESTDSWIRFGRTLKETCIQNSLQANCENKETGWLKNWIPLGTYLYPDHISTEFFLGKNCEEIDECNGDSVIIQ